MTTTNQTQENHTMTATPTLEEELEQLISLGYKDPHEYPDLLRRKLGEDLLEITAPYIDNFLSDMARQRLNSIRRASVARITNTGLADPGFALHSLWVPGDDGKITYKKIADMTAQDFEDRAAYLEAMAHGIAASAQWCRDVADLMRAEKVKVAGKLSKFPPLPVQD